MHSGGMPREFAKPGATHEQLSALQAVCNFETKKSNPWSRQLCALPALRSACFRPAASLADGDSIPRQHPMFCMAGARLTATEPGIARDRNGHDVWRA